jgi:hypothetical protein
MENRNESAFEGNRSGCLESRYWWISSFEEQVKVCNSKGEKKNDALALKTILSGLSSFIKENIGQCPSTKDRWLKLEKTYQSKKEDLEDNSNKINEGKESPKSPDCNISKSDDVEYFSTSEEEKLEIVCVELDDSYPMEEVEEELSDLKKKVE